MNAESSATPEGAAEHARVPDALARAVLHALLESEEIGIALARSGDWSHVMTSATYERLVNGGAALGHAFDRSLPDVLTDAVAPRAMLDAIVETGRAERATEVLERPEVVGGSIPIHVAFTFLRVRRVTPEADGVLVLAQDVSAQVHARRIGELFVALANDMTAARDEVATIRSSVQRASSALAADTASIFLLSPDNRRLHGALIGWDWMRTSFVADLEHWPNVARAISEDRPSYITASTARLAEEVWFERRGISAAICAPMSAHGRVVGVLFFDYFAPSAPSVDLTLAKSVADQCALLVERAEIHTGGRASRGDSAGRG